VESSTRLGGFRALKKTPEAPYTIKVNNREPRSQPRTSAVRVPVPVEGWNHPVALPLAHCGCVASAHLVPGPGVTYSFAETNAPLDILHHIVTRHSVYSNDANLVGHVERIVISGQAHVRLLAAVGPGEGEDWGKGEGKQRGVSNGARCGSGLA
jgi:hypothetical protein